MKRFSSISLALLLTVLLSGCAVNTSPDDAGSVPSDTASPGSGVSPSPEASPADAETVPDVSLHIVCTIFPQYDWVRQILGDSAAKHETALLLGNRVDLHSYQPSVDDIVKISNCDLFIYVGGESDRWVTEVLKNAQNHDMIVINLMEILGDGVKMDESVLGDEGNDQHGHQHHHDEGNGDEEHEEHEDEHVWLSLRHAELFCNVIANALASLDAGYGEEYRSNMTAYIGALAALDMAYSSAVNAAPLQTLLFADRFPFRYLLDDYGLSYYAAFSGCSAETEASFATIGSLAGKVNELGLHTVMVTESADKSIANTVIRNTQERNQQILVLDAMQSVTASDVRDGTTYLSIMESNLDVLKEALK